MLSFINKNIKENTVFTFYYYLHSIASDFMKKVIMAKVFKRAERN